MFIAVLIHAIDRLLYIHVSVGKKWRISIFDNDKIGKFMYWNYIHVLHVHVYLSKASIRYYIVKGKFTGEHTENTMI